MTSNTLAWSLLAIACIATIATYNIVERQRHSASLATKLEQIVPVAKHTEISCAALAATRPLVLLALGQSNAGNHGAPPDRAAEALTLIAEGRCIKATDPLPGATGTGGSIWQRLPALLSMQDKSRPTVLSVLAVDATSIEDWTSPRSPLRSRLASHVASMHHMGLAPSLVLWQQGEADARIGTGHEDYTAGLGRLAATLNEAGSNAPIVLALSTICRSAPSAAIRSASEARISSDPRFRLGPDTDTLSSEIFRNGCHLTAEGLDRAAQMWAITIRTEAPSITLAY